jgi:hypothetical protein
MHIKLLIHMHGCFSSARAVPVRDLRGFTGLEIWRV